MFLLCFFILINWVRTARLLFQGSVVLLLAYKVHLMRGLYLFLVVVVGFNIMSFPYQPLCLNIILPFPVWRKVLITVCFICLWGIINIQFTSSFYKFHNCSSFSLSFSFFFLHLILNLPSEEIKEMIKSYIYHFSRSVSLCRPR